MIPMRGGRLGSSKARPDTSVAVMTLPRASDFVVTGREADESMTWSGTTSWCLNAVSVPLEDSPNPNEFIDTTECRSTVLEGYFSDNSEKCGKCDNCTWDPDGKREMLLQSIENSGKTGVDAFDLIRSFPAGHRGRISIVLREMVNSNDIYVEGTKVFSSCLA